MLEYVLTECRIVNSSWVCSYICMCVLLVLPGCGLVLLVILPAIVATDAGFGVGVRSHGDSCEFVFLLV